MISARKLPWRKENNRVIFKMKLTKVIFSLFFVSCIFANAQTTKNVEKQSIFWTRYVVQLELNPKWNLVAEIDERFFLKNGQQNVLVSRVQGRYKANESIELGGGFAYFSVTTSDSNVNPGFKLPEYRTQQDVTVKQTSGKFTFNQRYQFEQRFMDKKNNAGVFLKNEFYLRYRFRIQADYKIWETEKRFLKAILSDEIMLNGGPNVTYNTFDQNRIYAALQFGFNKNISAELGYLNSYQQRSSGLDYYDRDIIRLSFFHKL